ncbi:TPA: SDR family oxidoreductase [Candidatus Poribacteria bacterium]|nr:SDR family oxidoreductase [Candidatus Poribacteria bacterium]HIB86264.1 SDR family oxidoreductase [Candidatus Poribacteria bacterium]HIB98956.1 SDR family oxidoreductase [Candidatus Poribacteria bacterium]HIC17388.1 SDR family oxidoreductase [Candidatus Poribacteria bacterium]HIM12247.1 SDR family oxidoreductase [Candidatus Poribacteria bacterium]
MRKVVITGASGLLGRALVREFQEQSKFTVIGTAFNRANTNLVKLDLLDFDSVSEFLVLHNPDFIIHAAAERRPDVCQNDPETTKALNIHATGNIACVASQIKSWMLYISTNYVFDGTLPPYTPNSATNPLNLYGESKLEGEKMIWQNVVSGGSLRLPILYGKVETLDESSVTQVAEAVVSRSEIEIDDWATRYPTYVDDVAYVCHQILEHRAQNPDFNGTYHWSGNQPMTKYHMAHTMAEVWGADVDHIIPGKHPPAGAPRPQNCQLDCSDLELLGIGKRTKFVEAIRIALASMNGIFNR